MDPRLLGHYNQELAHLREMGAEFARDFPKIAARLGMDGIEVTDPYVERLLEGFAFMAARVQLKLDAEFPRFTQRLLEIVYPNFLSPTPSMAIVQLQPDLGDANLAQGVTVARGSGMRSQLGKGDVTACRFRTAQAVTLWPLEIASAEYFSFAANLPLSSLPVGRRVKGGVRFTLRATGGLGFGAVALDDLRLHLSGADEVAMRLHERVLGNALGVLVMPRGARPATTGVQSVGHEFLPASCIAPVGFDDDEALLPVGLRNFQGYRLLQEYFAFPQRFLFFDIRGLGPALRRAGGGEVEVVVLFGQGDATLEGVVDASHLSLNCTPAVNLFERRCDRIHVDAGRHDFHVVPDRTRPMDYEVVELTEVEGHGVGVGSERSFKPFYAAFHTEDGTHAAYYSVQREPRLMSTVQKRTGPRSSYIGTEVFISLVDSQEAPYGADLRQLSLRALCTNRDLPMHMPVGAGTTDFTLDDTLPVRAVRALKGPSRPQAPHGEGGVAWKFINQLSLNYLSLTDTDAHQGAAALRDMLELYAAGSDAARLRQIEGLRSVRTQPFVRRLPMGGPITFGRGLQIELEVDEMAFQGGSAFLFGAVMERFFARHVSINGFTETVLRSQGRGEIMRWPARIGTRAVL